MGCAHARTFRTGRRGDGRSTLQGLQGESPSWQSQYTDGIVPSQVQPAQDPGRAVQFKFEGSQLGNTPSYEGAGMPSTALGSAVCLPQCPDLHVHLIQAHPQVTFHSVTHSS